jgi:two-component system LytT family response regulator
MIRTLIVDDEALAREGIRTLLTDEPGVEIAGEAVDGPDAVRAIQTLAPDLVFLDVQMPGFDGFQVLQRVAPVHLPAVIFITAYNEYACQAFDAQALDYLLKPISPTRFRLAMQRMRRELVHEEDLAHVQSRLTELLDSLQKRPATSQDTRWSRWFTVKDGQSFRVVRADEVSWAGSASNYVELHVRGRAYLVRITMNQLEERLDPGSFIRIHRSAIVNLASIDAIDHTVHGEFSVRLKDGTMLPLGRRYRHRLLR